MSASARPDYIELPATDVAATKAFYTKAFGWTWQDFGPTYAAVEAADGAIEVALNGEAVPVALHAPEAQNAVGPLVLFSSTDLEALLGGVESAGADLCRRAVEAGGPAGRNARGGARRGAGVRRIGGRQPGLPGNLRAA